MTDLLCLSADGILLFTEATPDDLAEFCSVNIVLWDYALKNCPSERNWQCRRNPDEIKCPRENKLDEVKWWKCKKYNDLGVEEY